MFSTLNDDRPYLESKYHKLDGTFESEYLRSAHLNTKYGRMAFHGYEYDPATGKTDEEIKSGLQGLNSELKQMSHPVAKATAIKYVLDNTRIDVNEHDYFIGIYSWDRLIRDVTTVPWEEEAFNKVSPNCRTELNEMCASGSLLYWPDYDHVIVDWLAVMDLGFPGLLKRARRYKEAFEKEGKLTDEKKDFFEAIEIEYSAIVDFIDRLYRYALTKTHEKATKIATCLRDLRDGAPQNTFEALELMYIFFMIIESVDSYQVRSLGNGLDRTLQRFYDADIANGRFSKEEIGEYLSYFMMQFSAIGNYWGHPFYLGGTDENGKCRVSELSYLILDVYKELGIYNPKIQVKVSPETPKPFVRKLLSMIRDGQNAIVFACDPGHIRAMMQYGVSYEEARDYELSGCVETRVRADEATTSGGGINAVKAVLYALYNGYDTTINKQYGLKTGTPDELLTFADFYHAVVSQLEFLVDKMMTFSNKIDPYLSFINPSTMYSATITRSLERGCDGYQEGVRYTTSNLGITGFANMVDGIMAVKEFVYDKKTVSLKELIHVLDVNWQGYEKLHAEILHSPHKYGNNDKETDRYAAALSKVFAMRAANQVNGKQGLFKPIIQTARFVWKGKITQASPDGRYAGEEISKNLTPSTGMDRNGVTALIESGLSMQPHMYAEGAVLDVMLHPTAVKGEEGLDIMQAVLETYMANDGMCIQFNVFNTDTLRKAKAHPEQYENLQVRVAGWNALWNNLTDAEQEAYITRAENIKD